MEVTLYLSYTFIISVWWHKSLYLHHHRVLLSLRPLSLDQSATIDLEAGWATLDVTAPQTKKWRPDRFPALPVPAKSSSSCYRGGVRMVMNFDIISCITNQGMPEIGGRFTRGPSRARRIWIINTVIVTGMYILFKAHKKLKWTGRYMKCCLQIGLWGMLLRFHLSHDCN